MAYFLQYIWEFIKKKKKKWKMDKYILLPVNTPTFVCLFLNEDKIDFFFI
jgi:hypothetical protein